MSAQEADVTLRSVSEASAFRAIAAQTLREGGRHIGRFAGMTVSSAFQPIFSLAHRRPVGYEALMRARTAAGLAVAPPDAFGMVRNDREAVFLDRLCRHVHVGNFRAAGDPENWLFLNVNPRVSIDGRNSGSFFAEMLAHHGLPPHRVVIEILEGAIPDGELLGEAVAYYRDLGCLVAIDDFGAGHSNFDRIWRMRPHIVKLDRGTVVQAETSPQVRRLLPNLVSLLHESGSLVVMEGIETETQAHIAMDAGSDFVQGYHFGRPAPDPAGPDGGLLPGLCERFRARADEEERRYRQELRRYEEVFEQAARRIASGHGREEASAALLGMPRVERCYFLDGEGCQLGSTIAIARGERAADPRFRPLADGHGAVWSRKPYFRRAMADPGVVQVTRPYLSIAGAHMCVTLSILLDTGAGPRVYCVDLDWPA